ncbi:hypothetical protein EB796_015705 [Bugula neritina]|uniref:Uncharacterized protein n=1 Tax=Bugula neritina TaxID=10212 RepID=A0A7J7JI29_BUGNE|nr:hypothetical protein EB796_015705 [Bugula neritina]
MTKKFKQANIENEFDSEDNSNTLAYLPEEQNVSIPEPPPLPPQKLKVPKNLKLYQDMPTEEREKNLERAVDEINKKANVMCVIS